MWVQSHRFAVHMQYENTRAHISNLIKISYVLYMYSYVYNFYRIMFIIVLIMFIIILIMDNFI